VLDVVHLLTEAERLTEPWSPRVVGRVGDAYVKVARLRGQFVWHAHPAEDELFLVLRGRLRIDLEGGAVEVEEGAFCVVPAGVRHNPAADEDCLIALIEPVSTAHTGDVQTERTRTIEQQLGR
jgi:mannose-6-phosphate isomerase-like protein (cupin superfamily)